MKIIYLVDDDERLCHQIKRFLEQYNYQVVVHHEGNSAVEEIIKNQPDMVILDLMLPKIDGFEVGRKLNGFYKGKIMVLTASNDDMDHVAGIEMGADDFLTKPVHPRVLLAHIKMLFRRTHFDPSKERGSKLNFGRLELNSTSRKVKLDGESVLLTASEYDLLEYFAFNVNKVVSRDKLLSVIRGIVYDGLDRSIDIKIGTLRKKLGDDGKNPKGIVTIRSKGYMLVGGAWASD